MTVVHKIYRDNVFEVRHMADEEHEGLRLDQFVALYLDTFSRELIKKKIKDKEILIIDRPGNNKPSSPIHKGDEVIINFYRSHLEDEFWRNEKLELQVTPDIVYEDQDLLVISKPAYMSTHPAGRHLFNCATVFYEMKYKHTIHPLHRIDRETSGILMLGKNPKMANEMMLSFENDDVKKCYLFIGKIQPHYNGNDYFEANERMGSPYDDRTRVVVESYPENSTEGKHAKTFFYIIAKNDTHVIGIACPQTGRQHQIRVHAKAHGIPLVGDKLYLGTYEMFQRFKDLLATPEDHDFVELPRQALHAIALKIPYQKKERLFITKIPKDLGVWIEQNTSFALCDLEVKIRATVDLYYKSHSL